MTSLCKLGKYKAHKDDENSSKPDYEPANQIIQKVLQEICSMPPSRQILIAATAGWIGGLLAMKVGRTLALAIGGGLILLQILCDKGFILINWDQVNSSFKQGQETTKNVLRRKSCHFVSVPSWIRTLIEFATQNMTLSVGLLGGFLIGLATC